MMQGSLQISHSGVVCTVGCNVEHSQLFYMSTVWPSSCPTRCAGVALHQSMVACHVIDCAVGHHRFLHHMRCLADVLNTNQGFEDLECSRGGTRPLPMVVLTRRWVGSVKNKLKGICLPIRKCFDRGDTTCAIRMLIFVSSVPYEHDTWWGLWFLEGGPCSLYTTSRTEKHLINQLTVQISILLGDNSHCKW